MSDDFIITGPSRERYAAALARVENVFGPKTRRAFDVALAQTALSRLALGFRATTDPYGDVWKPLKRARARNKKGGDIGKPLNDTGRLRKSFTTKLTPTGFVIGSNVIYTSTHQYGRGPIPARHMFPLRDKGLGNWEAALHAALRRAMNRAR